MHCIIGGCKYPGLSFTNESFFVIMFSSCNTSLKTAPEEQLFEPVVNCQSPAVDGQSFVQ